MTHLIRLLKLVVVSAVKYFKSSGLMDQEDAVQVANTHIAKYLKSFKGNSRVSTWAHIVSLNAGRSLIRQAGRKIQTEIMVEARDPVDQLSNNDLHHAIVNAFTQVPENNRQTALLHLVAGFPYQKIAQMQDISLGAVKSRIHRAREVLRRELADWKTGH